jgi:hypothetical protein
MGIKRIARMVDRSARPAYTARGRRARRAKPPKAVTITKEVL